MEYNDPEYLNLFKQMKEQRIETKDYSFDQLRDNSNTFNSNMLIRETPNYTADYGRFRDYNEPNINEVRRQDYSIADMNLNEFNIETRINGQNMNEVRRQEKEDRLNEVKAHLRQQMLNEVKETQEKQSLNEVVNFKDADYVTIEMFEKARYNSMMMVANRILPK